MRRPHALLAVACLLAVLTGCSTDAGVLTPASVGTPKPTPARSSTPTPTASTPTPTATPIALLASCDALYSADMLATLTSTLAPLNDPGLSDFLSTENVTGLEALNSGVPNLRCTWGVAGSGAPGLATTVARIDASTSDDIQQDLVSSGFGCDDLAGGTVCSISQQTIDQNDKVRSNGETHWFGNGFWVATHWVDADPDGYTADIATRLAG